MLPSEKEFGLTLERIDWLLKRSNTLPIGEEFVKALKLSKKFLEKEKTEHSMWLT
jgi:hypothetical protein